MRVAGRKMLVARMGAACLGFANKAQAQARRGKPSPVIPAKAGIHAFAWRCNTGANAKDAKGTQKTQKKHQNNEKGEKQHLCGLRGEKGL